MQSRAFYAAALTSLRYVEHRTPTGRRFGEDADARWKSFRGHLTTADRIDLLLRDADVEFPGAFGARTTFALRGVAEDEPFGAEWSALDGATAEAVWRRHVRDEAPPSDVRTLLRAMAAAWEITLEPVLLPTLTPTSRLLVVGPSAIAAVIEAFAAQSSTLRWSDQVVCIATPPAHRQLASNAAAILRSNRATQLHAGGDGIARLGDRVLVESADGHADDLLAARAVRS